MLLRSAADRRTGSSREDLDDVHIRALCQRHICQCHGFPARDHAAWEWQVGEFTGGKRWRGGADLPIGDDRSVDQVQRQTIRPAPLEGNAGQAQIAGLVLRGTEAVDEGAGQDLELFGALMAGVPVQMRMQVIDRPSIVPVSGMMVMVVVIVIMMMIMVMWVIVHRRLP